jgi:hypothetical protein
MSSMSGFMTIFNKILAAPATTVGLGKQSHLRTTLQDFLILVHITNIAPSDITKLVGTDLPHVYGYTDASRSGMGGIVLPATRWTQPYGTPISSPTSLQLSIRDKFLSTFSKWLQISWRSN